MVEEKSKRRYLFYVDQAYSFSILRPIQEEIIERGGEVAWYLTPRLSSNGSVQKLRVGEMQLSRISDVMRFNAIATLTPENIVCDFFPGIKVQLFHGVITNKRSANCQDHFKIRGFFDLYCTPSAPCTTPFKKLEAAHNYFKVVETGWSKFDHILDLTTPDALSEDLFEDSTKPTIIYSSTFTERLTSTVKLLPEIERVVKSGKHNWICSFHPKMRSETVKQYKRLSKYPNFRYIEPGDTTPLLKIADVMLCDSSSIIAEFLALEKSVVTFRNTVGGPHLINFTTPSELEEHLDRALSVSSEHLESIRVYNREIHPYRDMKSSARVLDAIDSFISNDLGKMGSKPLNLLRKFKVRRVVGCFPELSTRRDFRTGRWEVKVQK